MSSSDSVYGIDLFLITGDEPAARIERATQRALSIDSAHRIAVQLRSRHLPDAERRALGLALRDLTRERAARLFVNDDVELALQLDADGLHLPERTAFPRNARQRWKGRPIASACHDAAGLERAALEGFDLALLSPVHAVPGKNAPLGIEGFAALAQTARLPVYALGGLHAGNAGEVMVHGAAGLAVIRAVYAATDPAAATTEILRAIDRGRSAAPRTKA